jgi:hypothetical protein
MRRELPDSWRAPQAMAADNKQDANPKAGG